MRKVFKILTIIFLLIFLFPNNSFCRSGSGNSLGHVESRWIWCNLSGEFKYKVSVNVDKGGLVTASISDFKLRHPEAYVSIRIQPEITKIKIWKNWYEDKGLKVYITFHCSSVCYNGKWDSASKKEIWGPDTFHKGNTYDSFF